jgi:hypothetical protein
MSVLGLSCDSRGVRLSARLDPAKPPQVLTRLGGVTVPASVPVEAASVPAGSVTVGEIFERSFPPAADPAAATPEWLSEAVTAWFRALLAAIGQDPDAQVLLLGGVENLAVVAPPQAQPAQMEAFRGAAGKAGVPVTIVAHHVAALAGLRERFEPLHPFMVCDWAHDLDCGAFLPHPTFIHLSPVGQRFRRKALGPSVLADALIRAVTARLLEAPAAELQARLRHHVDEGVAAFLAGGELRLSPLPFTPPPPPTPSDADAVLLPEEPRPAETSPEASGLGQPAASASKGADLPGLDQNAITAAWAQLAQLAGNFLARALQEASQVGTEGVDTTRGQLHKAAQEARRQGAEEVILCGPMFNVPSLRAAVKQALAAHGFQRVAEAGGDDALLGVHYCVLPRPLLPYDCGFLLKPAGATRGIGTLVLVRPAQIGEERQSEVLEIPLAAGTALEMAFYTRRLDDAAQAVLYDVMRQHVFVPSRTAAGQARICVAMRVEQGDERLATVTVDIHDLNNHEHIRFERLPLRGEARLEQLPLRDARQLPALAWATKLAEAPAKSTSPNSSVAAWRRVLEQRAALLGRQDYADYLVGAVRNLFSGVAEALGVDFGDLAEGLKTWLVTEAAVTANPPAEFQTEGRKLLFATMRRAAASMAQHGGGHCRTWLRQHPEQTSVPSDESPAQQFVNSVSQDRAGSSDTAELAQALAALQTAFHHACGSPHALNIDW